MATEFGKLNFAVGFNRTSAFPLDANSYFENYADALAAATGAAEVGSSDSAYYIGQILIVNDKSETDNKGLGLYQITASKTLVKFGQASSADELGERVSALESQITTINGKLILATAEKDGFMSKGDFSKLAGIESGAQANIIESVKVDGTALEITDKAVNIDLAGALAPYAKSVDVTTALGKKVDAVEGKGLSTNDYDAAAVAEVAKIKDKADASTVTELSGKVTKNTEDISAINGKLVGLTGAMHFIGTSTTDPMSEGGPTVENHPTFVSGDVCLFGKKEFVYNGTAWAELGDEGSHLTKTEAAATYLTKTDAETTYITAEKAATDIATAKSEAIANAGTAADTKIATALTNYTTTSDLNAILDTKADETTVTGLGTRIAALESVGAEANYVKSVDETQLAVSEAGKLSITAVDQSKVTGLADALNDKVDKVEGSTLLSSADKNKLDALVIGESGVEVNASNVQGLGNWITTNRDSIAGLFDTTSATKLNGIEAGAQVNDLEVVKIAGTMLPISDKTVDIPIATAEALGVVMSSVAENKVSVGADGTMEINSVNVSKLTQTDGEYLILNGGSSTT